MDLLLTGHSFKTAIYESVVGKIEVENEILADGSIATSMFVVYPDGLADEIFTVQEGFQKLELEIN
jgi:hypothetical protein